MTFIRVTDESTSMEVSLNGLAESVEKAAKMQVACADSLKLTTDDGEFDVSYMVHGRRRQLTVTAPKGFIFSASGRLAQPSLTSSLMDKLTTALRMQSVFTPPLGCRRDVTMKEHEGRNIIEVEQVDGA